MGVGSDCRTSLAFQVCRALSGVGSEGGITRPGIFTGMSFVKSADKWQRFQTYHCLNQSEGKLIINKINLSLFR